MFPITFKPEDVCSHIQGNSGNKHVGGNTDANHAHIYFAYSQYSMWYWKYNFRDIFNLGNITKRLLKEDNHLVRILLTGGRKTSTVVRYRRGNSRNDSDSVAANKMLCFNVLLVFARKQ